MDFSSSWVFLLLLIPGLLLVIGQWIGVLAIGKGNGWAWWLMLVGTLFLTVEVVWSGFVELFVAWYSSALHETYYEVVSPTVFASLLGCLLFAVGFAFWCFRVRGLSQRVKELETIASAQAEELEKLRKK